jgi:hypothetical protein
MQDLFSLGYSGMPSEIKEPKVAPGWMMPVADFLSRLGSDNSSNEHNRHYETRWLSRGGRSNFSRVRLINAAFAGHKAEVYLSCLATKVPLDTDLFIVDAATVPQNDAKSEALLRSLLALPKAPAVVLMHFTNWCWHQDVNGELAIKEARSKVCYQPRRLASSWTGAMKTEQMLDGLGSYYGLPSLSMRRAFSSAALSSAFLPRRHRAIDDFFDPASLTTDGLHPHRAGCRLSGHRRCERERYSQLAAALLNTYFWEEWNAMLHEEEITRGRTTASSLFWGHQVLEQGAAESLAAERLLGHESSYRAREVLRRQAEGLGFPCHTLHKAAQESREPTKLARSRANYLFERCFAWAPGLKRRPERAFAPILSGSVGWNFTEFDTSLAADARELCAKEKVRRARTDGNSGGSGGSGGTNGSVAEEAVKAAGFSRRVQNATAWAEAVCLRRLRLKSRPGITAFTIGSRARVQLDAGGSQDIGVSSLSPGKLRATISLTYLSSYEGMGTVGITCTDGCGCNLSPGSIDAHRGTETAVGERMISVYKSHSFPVKLDSYGRCVLVVEVLNHTRSSGHKFKISELALVAWREKKVHTTLARTSSELSQRPSIARQEPTAGLCGLSDDLSSAL